jgi:hypothetical protein
MHPDWAEIHRRDRPSSKSDLTADVQTTNSTAIVTCGSAIGSDELPLTGRSSERLVSDAR